MAAIEMAEGDFSIERFPLGYPQFSALIGAHPTFSVSQRFSIVRARLLLVKQQRVMTLEKKLEELDLQEPQALNLGSIQADTNHARTKILKDLDEALADYDGLVKRNTEMLQLPRTSERSIASLLNWVNATGSITRRETNYLHGQDLCAVGGREPNGVMWVESLIVNILVHFHESFIQRCRFKRFQYWISASAAQPKRRLFLFEGQTLCIITHLCITAVIVLLLLVPMVIMQATSNSFTLQMICVTLMSVLFTVIMSGPMKARTAEIFGASATYAAFLVVFLSVKGMQV